MSKKLAIVILFLAMLTTQNTSYTQTASFGLVTGMEWNADGTLLATIDNTQSISILETKTFQNVIRIESRQNNLNDLAWSPDSQYVATIDASTGSIRVWNASTGQSIAELETGDSSTSNFARIAWSPSGNVVASVVSDIYRGLPLRFWQIENGHLSLLPFSFGATAYDITWHPNGQALALANVVGVYVFENVFEATAEPQLIAPFQFSIAWSPAGDKIAGFDSSGLIQILDPIDGSVEQLIQATPIGVEGGLAEIEWFPDNTTLVTYGYDGDLKIWNTITGEMISRTQFNRQAGRNLMTLSPFGGRIAVGGDPLSQSDITTLQVTPGFTSLENGAIQIVVPAPSPERLQAITDACGLQPAADQALTAEISTQDYAGFTTQLEALPEDALPPGCRADLLAVAAALDAQGE